MLAAEKLRLVDRYWIAYFGLPAGELFGGSFRVVTHGGQMEGYHGVFALFRENRVIVSVPPGWEDEMIGLLSGGECTPSTLALALAPVALATIGPAFIGYAEEVVACKPPVRSLKNHDAPAFEEFQLACDETEWDHGGSSIEEPCSGVFENGLLVALGGYEVWGGTIAHISVITRPDFRGQGLGRRVVAHVAQRALEAGLLSQYRTLEGNGPSMQIAKALRFERYATSIAVRLRE